MFHKARYTVAKVKLAGGTLAAATCASLVYLQSEKHNPGNTNWQRLSWHSDNSTNQEHSYHEISGSMLQVRGKCSNLLKA